MVITKLIYFNNNFKVIAKTRRHLLAAETHTRVKSKLKQYVCTVCFIVNLVLQ